MGRAASRLADRLVLTNDNPRHEEPLEILRQIQSGLASGVSPNVIPERSEALAQALAQARPGDVVLVAGKGHEDYQEVGEERRPFSDRDWVRRLLAEGSA
jgi:UDP-N-acetylmuramoyl-L-alanyl-D-glutamate--2,6-diaminopimelate ligase